MLHQNWEARRKIFDIVEDVQRPNRHYTITENGRSKAVVLSADEYASLIETVEIMNDPELMKSIRKGESEYEKGQYVTLDAILKQEGYVQVPSHSRKVSSKRIKKTS